MHDLLRGQGGQGYQDTGPAVLVPCHGQWENRSAGQQAVNVPHEKILALSEQATTTLKDWRLLRKPRYSMIPVAGRAAPDGR